MPYQKWMVAFSLFVTPVIGGTLPYHFRFVEFDSYKISGGLPPEIQVTFQLACNEKLVRVLREQSARPVGEKVLIGLGGIAWVDDTLDCQTPPVAFEAPAGTAFSGREYEVVRIGR